MLSVLLYAKHTLNYQLICHFHPQCLYRCVCVSLLAYIQHFHTLVWHCCGTAGSDLSFVLDCLLFSNFRVPKSKWKLESFELEGGMLAICICVYVYIWLYVYTYIDTSLTVAQRVNLNSKSIKLLWKQLQKEPQWKGQWQWQWNTTVSPCCANVSDVMPATICT